MRSIMNKIKFFVHVHFKTLSYVVQWSPELIKIIFFYENLSKLSKFWSNSGSNFGPECIFKCGVSLVYIVQSIHLWLTLWSKLWSIFSPNYSPIMVQIIHLWLNKKILYHTYFNFFQQYVVQCGLIVVQIEMWRLNRLFNCHFGNVVPIVFPKWNPNVVQIVIQLWL